MPHCNKKMLSFFLTTKCNLCCKYCYNAEERNSLVEQTIPEEIAYSAIDWYFSNNSIRHIRFYGPGEPTCAFNHMKNITAYAKSHHDGGDRVTIELQTNGVFSQEICEWIGKNINIVWISLDGTKDIQNLNRPLNPNNVTIFQNNNSAEIIEENIRHLLDSASPNLMIGIRSTINSLNVHRQIEMIDYFHSLGVEHVWTDPIFCSVLEQPVIKKSSTVKQLIDLDEYVEEYIRARKYAEKNGLFYGSFLAVNFDGESPYHCRSCHPLSSPHITTDGYISACDMVLFGSNAFHMEPLVVGRWNDSKKQFEIFEEKVKYLHERNSNKMEHCIECPAKLHCGGYCLGEILNETGNLYGQDKRICDAVKKLYNILGDLEEYDYFHP